jgi:single-stranded DNA-binding protein
MSHTVTGKLNRDANKHPGQNGTTFFVDIGEKNFNFKTKQNEYTNYTAPVFAKDAQAVFYEQALVTGSIVSVTGTGIIVEMPTDPKYPPRLVIQDAKIVYVATSGQGQQAQPQQRAPQPPAQQNGPAHAPPAGFDSFDDDIPF